MSALQFVTVGFSFSLSLSGDNKSSSICKELTEELLPGKQNKEPSCQRWGPQGALDTLSASAMPASQTEVHTRPAGQSPVGKVCQAYHTHHHGSCDHVLAARLEAYNYPLL